MIKSKKLVQVMRQKIEDGTYASGMRLPSMKETSQHYGVSLTTVRNAYAALEQSGLIAKQRGRGTFVKAGSNIALSKGLDRNHAFTTDETNRSNMQILRVNTDYADECCQRKLCLQKDELVYTLQYTYEQRQQNSSFSVNHVLKTLHIPEALLSASKDPYEILTLEHGFYEELHHKPDSADSIIYARLPSKKEALQAHFRQDEALLAIDAVKYLSNGCPYIYVQTLMGCKETVMPMIHADFVSLCS